MPRGTIWHSRLAHSAELRPRLAAAAFGRLAALWAVPILISASLAILYTSLLPSDYTTANQGVDGGDLLTAILTGGVPHPTGYPTYLLVGTLFQWLPFGSPYWKGALVSAIFSALAVGLVCLYAGRAATGGTPSRWVRMIATGLALGFAPVLWSQAVIVEVYGLQAFVTACTLLWVDMIQRENRTAWEARALLFFSVCIGLGLGNHITLLLLFPALALAFFIAWRRGDSRRNLLIQVILIACSAALVYSVLPMRASGFPPVNWGNAQTLDGFAWLVSGRLYHELAFGLPAADIPARLLFFAGWFKQQFGVTGLLLGLLGAVQSTILRNRLNPYAWWTFAACSIFSLSYSTNDSLVYLMPVAMVFSLWIGSAASILWTIPAGLVPAGKLLVGLYLVTVAISFPATYHSVDPRGEDSARVLALDCLASLPRQAVLLTQADADTFALWYYHDGLRLRSDVSIITRGLVQFSWYRLNLQHSNPDLLFPADGMQDWEAEFSQLNPGRTICQCGDRASP